MSAYLCMMIRYSGCDHIFFQDGNGTLEGSEFKRLVADLLQSSTGRQPSPAEVEDLESDLLKGCDLNNDGRIDGKELSVILLAIANATKNGAAIYSTYDLS